MSDPPPGGADGPPVALAMRGVTRHFRQAGRVLEVLRGVDLDLRAGAVIALTGPSGAGKSTLLHIAGLLEAPTGGSVLVDGREAGQMADAERTRLRRRQIGFVYQFHHLLPEFSAQENVMLPQLIAGRPVRAARDHAAGLLASVGLGERLHHRPARLSGGEQQRVAIARAIANSPRILLADEPTGNLDAETAETVFEQLRRIVAQTGLAALVATHNHQLAARMDRVRELRDGRLTAPRRPAHPP